MRASLAVYCGGILTASYVTDPARVVLVVPGTIAVLLFLLGYLAPHCNIWRTTLWLVIVFLAGLLWHGQWAASALHHQFPHQQAGSDVLVSGRIVSIPETDPISTGFEFQVRQGPELLAGQRLLLRDYSGLPVRAGQDWQLLVRLRPPYGTANPGAYDSESQLMQRGIRAVGYTRAGPDNRVLDNGGLSVAALRQYLLERLNRVLVSGSPAWQLLPALLIGYRGQISNSTRELLAATGTSHLFVISGLHIGLLAMLAYAGAGWLLRHSLPLRLSLTPRQNLAALCAIAVSTLYSLAAGFSLPTQRALVMVVVFMGASLCGKAVTLAGRFLLAMTLVLMLNPLAGMNAGFWLSFAAVGALLFFRPVTTGSGWRELLRAQWSIFVVLFLPLTVWMGQVTLIAPLVNLVAVPLMGMLLLPLAMLFLVVLLISETVGAVLMLPLHYLLQWTIDLLAVVDANPWLLPSWTVYMTVPEPFWPVLVCVVIAVLLLLLPLRTAMRWLAPVLLLPVLVSARQPNAGELILRVLDVGQGLAVLLRYGDRTLLYDTGAAFSDDFDMGAAVVVPVLRRLGVKQVDLLIVSHGDNDHSGGLGSVLQALPVKQLLLGQSPPEEMLNDSGDKALTWRFCRAGQQWHWQELELRMLHPERAYTESNLNSCVLRVQLGKLSVLFSGDINRRIEVELAREQGAALASTVLIAPHHGSKDASSYPFIKTVNPAWVIFASGAYNRFSHPAAEVQQRYRQLGARLLSTASGGMLSLRLDGDSETVEMSCYRLAQPRYWRRSQIQPACRYN